LYLKIGIVGGLENEIHEVGIASALFGGYEGGVKFKGTVDMR
jgi:hypothetical protein